MRVSQTLSTMPTLAVMKPIGGDGGQRLLLFQVHLIRVDNATIDHLVLVLYRTLKLGQWLASQKEG